MTEPISFTNASPRFALPFLSPGQAQKEFTVNQAHAVLDSLIHLVVQGTSNTPPASPQEGECWLVGSNPSGTWANQAETIAAYQAGVWLFIAPVVGMQTYDLSAGQSARLTDSGWVYAANVASPAGGTNIDSEARTAIDALISALSDAGLLPTA